MPAFSDYAFYRENGGQLSEATYRAYVHDAYAEILSQTNGAALSAPSSMQDSVKRCECALVDTIAGYKDTAALVPKGVTSVNNDGLNVSTGSGSVNNKSLVQAEAEERADICTRHLQWPVNLMNGWL